MNERSYRALGTWLAIGFCSIAVKPGLAMDPVCSQLNAATQALRTKPFHMYMTETRSYPNPAMAKAAGQIGLNGTTQSEEISTGKSVYVLSKGKWIDMQTTFAAMEGEKDSDSDTKKALDESKCKVLPDETVFGQASSVYLQSTPGLGIETKLWISKSTHLPVRSEITHNDTTMKQVTVARYEYTGVQAPANSMTMQEMIKSHAAR